MSLSKVEVVIAAVFFVGAALLGYGGFALGITASYYLGDRGDVGSAFIAVVTCPIGTALGVLAAWLAAKRAAHEFARKL